MEQLDKDYLYILKHGLLRARDAAYEPTNERVKRETEHLHEIPTLIGEENLHRHIDYLIRMRGMYMEWYRENRPDMLPEIRSVFYPAWTRMAVEVRRVAQPLGIWPVAEG
jgi:hypothetical protein